MKNLKKKRGTPDQSDQLNGVAREAVSEIHIESMVASGEVHPAEVAAAEDDSEELELEEAQAEAEAMLDAEARGNGTVDARAEVRAPSPTAGYTQRSQQRSGYDRPDMSGAGETGDVEAVGVVHGDSDDANRLQFP